MKNIFLILLFIISTSFSPLPGVYPDKGGRESWRGADEYKIRFGSVIPKDSPWEDGINEYIKWAEVKSGAQLKFKTYLGGQLGGEVEMIKSVAMGTLDAGAFSSASIAEALNIPELQVFELPFLFNSDEEADIVMDAMFKQMSDLLDKKGVKLVMWGTNGWRCLGTKKKPVVRPSDLKGLKMRSQESDVYIQFYKAAGATPVPIATPDVLVALKTGMVDGFDQTPIFAVSTGWIGAVKNFTLTNHIYQPGAVIVSKRTYEKMPAELKPLLIAEGKRDELAKKSRALVRADNAEVLGTIEKNFSVKIIKPSDSQRAEFIKAALSVHTSMESVVGKTTIQSVNSEIAKFRQKK